MPLLNKALRHFGFSRSEQEKHCPRCVLQFIDDYAAIYDVPYLLRVQTGYKIRLLIYLPMAGRVRNFIGINMF